MHPASRYHSPTMPIRRLFTFSRADTPGESAATYVPIVLLSRGLAFLRFYLVVRILGNVGKPEFGLYNPAIELINWLVPLVMLGLSDVAERYAARFEKEARLPAALKRHLFRLLIIGLATILILLAASRWLVYPLFKLPNADHSQAYGVLLLAACASAILLLAFYQYLAALLRGLRAYAPAAGLEISFAILFVLFSSLAAIHGTALTLIGAYALSLIIPTVYFGALLLAHLKSPQTASPLQTSPSAIHYSQFNRFAAWSLIRLQLVMSFGFFNIWSVSHVASVAHVDPQAQTADYATPARIAQQLALVAITLWASCYGIAARHWSHHQARRAKVQLFRVGKFGAVFLTLAAVFLLLTRNLFALIMPTAYTDSINLLLPPMLALFLWYGLLAFASTFGDLQEAPYKGATLWALAVAIQLALIFIPNSLSSDPKQQVLLASAIGLAVSLLLFAPILLWHPFRFNATAVPMVLLAIAPISLFSPSWIVDIIAPAIMLPAVVFLYFTGLLIRPLDRRAYRRYRARKLALAAAATR